MKVSPEAYAAIYDAGVMHGDQEDYNWVMAKYLSSTFAPEQQIYLHALASSPVPYIQQRTLSFAISGLVRQQDIITLIDQVATLTPVGHVSVWLFFMVSLTLIFRRIGISLLRECTLRLLGNSTSFLRLFVRLSPSLT